MLLLTVLRCDKTNGEFIWKTFLNNKHSDTYYVFGESLDCISTHILYISY